MADVFSLGFRAGFWRRAFSLIVDALVIGIPFQILVVWLYAATDGAVQVTGMYVGCHIVDQPKYALDPPPPKQSNFAKECRSSVIGLETSRTLVVGRAFREGSVTKTVSQNYSLDSDGQPRNALHLDWLEQLALLAYLITMEHRTGVTLGNYVFRIEVVSWKSPGSPGIPLLNSIIRQLSQWLGLVPIVAFGVYEFIAGGEFSFVFNEGWTIKSITLKSATNEVRVLLICLGLCVLWSLCNLILIVAKRDPLFDRLARVTVLRD
ncbi:MAG: RDD family protein [Hyphomicrobiales bacterium]|nr:RDD family protein [Hyphomicrobiales bacterium]MBV9517401.1 RDD family protein [Hyphomicrobiales bacterium]